MENSLIKELHEEVTQINLAQIAASRLSSDINLPSHLSPNETAID